MGENVIQAIDAMKQSQVLTEPDTKIILIDKARSAYPARESDMFLLMLYLDIRISQIVELNITDIVDR